MSKKIAIALAAVGLFSINAYAQDAGGQTPAPQGKRFAACATEVQKFCADVEKGKGLMRKCLDSHASELSDGCKTALAAHAAAKAQEKAPQ